MGWFEHGVEVPVDAENAKAAFGGEPDRWLPPVAGIHAPHEVETRSPLRLFGSARFRVDDSWRNGEVVSRPVRVEFGREPFGPALVVLDGELSVDSAAHCGTSVRFRGRTRGVGHALRRAVGAALAGAAVRSVVDDIATRLQQVVAASSDEKEPPCSTY